jgi:Family of unknown function (DUF6134)
MRKYIAFIRCLAAHLILIACITTRGRWANAQALRPADQVREYALSVNGKLTGQLSQRIRSTDDSTLIVSTNAEVKLSYVVYTYRYSFSGSETWHGNRLEAVDNHAEDDGKKLAVRAAASSGGSTIAILGKNPVTGPAIAMTTNYWRAPEETQGGTIAVLDADQGSIHELRVDKVTEEQIHLSDRSLECRRFQLVGDLPAELWFDHDNLLVQQRTTEDGRPVEIRLVKITPINERGAN